MLNKKGFTLVELLAMMVILGILMAVTIPNIVGIAEANKKQAYAEDALKFKNIVEYKLRVDEDYIKPNDVEQCVVVSLTHLVADENGVVDLEGTEFENAPYGGDYLVDYSYVVMKKEKDAEGKYYYKYYVQLVEYKDPYYKGVKLREYTDLESSKYLDKITESEDAADFNGMITNFGTATSVLSAQCSGGVQGIYYSNSFLNS